MAHLEVLLDLNALGRGFAAEATRTGIFASEGLLCAMLARNDLALFCSAEASWAFSWEVFEWSRIEMIPHPDFFPQSPEAIR